MITICLTYFKSLTLKNLDAALYSLRQQNLSRVSNIVLLDNDTEDDPNVIAKLVAAYDFPIDVDLYSHKHGDVTKTHSWSSNAAIGHVHTPWIFFTRADYIVDFEILSKFTAAAAKYRESWPGFITSNGYHLALDVETCETHPWRVQGTNVFRGMPGSQFDYTVIDSGVWMAQKMSVDFIGGFDEALTAWGHAQTEFQSRLGHSGVEFIRIPEVLFYHPHHAGDRDLELANKQLRDRGLNVQDLWDRYEGMNPYR